MDKRSLEEIDVVAVTSLHIPAITEVYAEHVLHGTGSFEETPPTVEQMRERFNALDGQSYPYIAAISGDNLVGFAYAGPHKLRAAYRFTVEDSIYVDGRYQGLRIGRRLLDELIRLSSSAGYKQMMAVIGDSENASSISLHKAAGFTQIGIAKSIGFKHDQWRNVVYMQRAL